MTPKKAIRTVRNIIEALEARIAPASFVWNNSASGNWSDQSKWLNTTVGGINNGVPSNDTDIANFDTTSGSPTVTLDNNFTIQQLTFTGSGTSPLIVPTILGSALSLNFDRVGSAAVISSTGGGNPVISAKVTAFAGFGVNIQASIPGTLTFNGPLSEVSGYFNKVGDGVATFGGAAQNTFFHANGLQVSFGTLRLSKDAGAIPMTGNITINGGTLAVTQDPTTGNEEIDNNSRVTINGSGIFRIDAPLGETVGSVAGSGIIDLQGHRLSVANTSTFGGIFPNGGTIGGVSPAVDQHLDLSGNQSIGKDFTVDGFVRMLPGSNFSSSNFTLQIGASTTSILDGNGTLGNVFGGTVAGDTFITPGTLGVGGKLSVASLAPGASNLDVGFTVAGTGGAGAATGHDQIVVRPGGAVNITGGSLSTSFASFIPSIGQSFTLIDNQGTQPITGTLTDFQNGGAPLPEGATVQRFDGGNTLVKLSYVGGDGNDLVFNVVSNVVSVGAPTFSPDGKSATFTDVDGDIVTVKTSKGGFSAANFAMVNNAGAAGAVLQTLDLSFANFGKQFKGASIKVKVAKTGAGDGFVNIGRINATGVDLLGVKVIGELEQVDAGDANGLTPGLGSLKAIAMGVNGLSPLFGFNADPAGGLTSSIVGKVGTLQVGKGATAFTGQSGIVRAFIDVTGGTKTKLGIIDSIAVDQLTGQNDAPSVLNGTGIVTFASGTVRASGAIGIVNVTGNVTGAAGSYSGDIWSRRAIGSVTVGGNVTGAGGLDSGAIFVGNPDDGTAPLAKSMAAVTIGGNLAGGSGEFSGTLFADSGLGVVKITGSVLAGTSGTTGAIVTLGGIGKVNIGGTLTGGANQYAGSIVAFGGDLGKVVVTQAMVTAGNGFGLNGIFVNGKLGSVTTGALNATGTGTGAIVALGSIASVNVSGNATNWNIAAGFDTEFAQDANGSATDGVSYNPDATIGSVTIGGNLAGSSITAGTLFGADFKAGGADDIHMPGDTTASVLSRIASIVVSGQTSNSVFEAQTVSALRIAGILAPLTAGIDNLPVGTNSFVTEL